MFRQLTPRQKLLAAAVPPLAVLGLVALLAIVVSGSATLVGVIGLAAAAAGAAAVVLMVRTLDESGDDVASIVDEFANQRLPLLLDGLRNPGTPPPHLDPVDLSGHDEAVERLGRALTTIQEAAVEVADEQRVRMQRGLSELVINLARRNQSLLDRQIEFIDDLETREEDPDRLEDLFSLDHLATRMRRNAESLLVVAGAEPPRRRGGPVSVSDILRVALSEIEDYRHVNMGEIDESSIGAQQAIDLAHLMSELLENATQFSPPETRVEVTGSALQDGDYIISVADRGIGMTPEQIADANEILADPPDLELGLSRSLGFMVIGRLARRLDVTVELNPSPGGGITALVLLRSSLLTGGGQSAPAAEQSGRQMKAAIAGTETAGAAAPQAPPPPAAPEVLTGAGASPSVNGLPAEPARSGPSVPAEGPISLGRRSTDTPGPASDPDPAPAVVRAAPEDEDPAVAVVEATPVPADATQARPATQSDALAKLMGVPLGDSVPPAAAAPPAKLEDALPSGVSFDSSMANLLQGGGATPEPGRTAAGLVKRDRSKSQAPQGEGRNIPGGGQSVTASGRSPEEIREMLAKYRGGRSRPGGGPAAGKKPNGNESGGPA